jgi:hypothetical protein
MVAVGQVEASFHCCLTPPGSSFPSEGRLLLLPLLHDASLPAAAVCNTSGIVLLSAGGRHQNKIRNGVLSDLGMDF